LNATPTTPFPGLAGQTSAPGDSNLPYLRPAPAATMIVLDDSGSEPRVLMGRRNPNLVFMPGLYVFPGGRIEPGDRRMNVAGALHDVVEMRLMSRVQRPSPGRARALALAAIRETFEETGMLIGSRDYGAPESAPEGAWSAYAAHGCYPELDRLHLIARAITPPRRARRFDTAFFAVSVEAVVDTVEGMTGPDRELVDLVWLPLSKAASLDMPGITRTIIIELQARIAAGMSPMLPVPVYRNHRGAWRRDLL
jgi:8-oxo-dGTP pyrophosphatase MutT (NUDIX family)